MTTNSSTKQRTALSPVSRSAYLLWLIWVVWLPFAIPEIRNLLQSHFSMIRLVATLVAVALFYCVYLWATWRNTQRLIGASSEEDTILAQWLPIAVLLVLSFIAVTLSQEIGTPFIFTSAYIGGRLAPARAVQSIIVLALLVAISGLLDNFSWSYLVQGIFLIVVVGIVTALMVRAVLTRRELLAAREEIARLAITAERLRIARDLHDLLGHNLSLIALKSELARRLISVSPEQAAVEIGDVEQAARSTLQEVREAVSNYRKPSLANELHAAQEILTAAGIVYQYGGYETIEGTLSPPVESVLAWAVREGVTNVIRHSRAHHCSISMTQGARQVSIEIVDDGKVAPPAAATVPVGATSNGLLGLTERVAVFDGVCRAEPQKNGGFRLTVSIPLTQKEGSVQR